MEDGQILTIILSLLPCFVVALIAGHFIIPWLRALKAGQTIREIGPKWHNSKAGTPAMGGLIFILATALGTLQALAMQRAKVNVAAVMAMVENMPSGTAQVNIPCMGTGNIRST